ncbi:MAG: zinc ribbon domain-containing protein [Thermoplasmata archaeon]
MSIIIAVLSSSRSGYIDKNNRHCSVFRCKNCGFEFNANLNAARNIGVVGTSEYFRLFSASQSVRFDEHSLTVRGSPATSSKALARSS